MATAVMLDERHFKAASKAARKLGTTPEGYLQSLIEKANLRLDEILAPVRRQFKESGVTEEELEAAVQHARQAIHAKSKRSRKR